MGRGKSLREVSDDIGLRDKARPLIAFRGATGIKHGVGGMRAKSALVRHGACQPDERLEGIRALLQYLLSQQMRI